MTQNSGTSFSKKRLLYTVVSVLVLAALSAVGYAWIGRTSPVQPGGPLEQVTIAVNTQYAGTCPVFVAQAKGYFGSEGLLVTIQPYTSGKAALDAALRGQAHLGTVADVPLVFATMNRQPVSVVATISTAEKDHGIVGRKDKGVGAPSSLKGKRIGVTQGTSGHFFLDAFLNRQKLSMNDVKIRNFKPEELSDALAKGEVDAIATWEPILGLSQAQLGGNGTVFYGEGVYESTFNIAGARDYIVSHPETIKKIMRALVRAGRVCKDMPNEAVEIAAKAMKTDATKLKGLWPSYRFSATLDQSLLLVLEDETRWAIKNKLVSGTDMPNYLNHFYLDALQAVAPAAVTVIH